MFLSTLIIGLIGCNQVSDPEHRRQFVSETASSSVTARRIYSDSLRYVDDAAFADVRLKRIISQKAFEMHKAKYSAGCILGTGQRSGERGLYLIRDCNEVCDTYIGEAATNKKLLLPSTFDVGVSTVLPSPDCKRLIVWSTYDMPDYGEFYGHRSELFSFTIDMEKGIDGVQPLAKHFSKRWSLGDVTWVDNKTLAVKVYSNANPTNKDYKYYLVNL